MKPLMRAQSQMGDYIHGRSFQYAARSLLYYDGAPWQLMTLRVVVSRIGALLPTELREARVLLNRGRTLGSEGVEADRAAEWVGRHGEQHGFRVPDISERGRATGCGAYLDSLRLGQRDLYDAQGNHFDRVIVAWRLSRYVLAWTRGDAVPLGPEPLDVAGLEQLYQRVRIAVEADGVPAVPMGVPADVQRAAAMGWVHRATGGEERSISSAAEDGRADQ